MCMKSKRPLFEYGAEFAFYDRVNIRAWNSPLMPRAMASMYGMYVK